MSLNKGIGKIEVALRWDPSPLGEPATDLDLVAAPYPADDPDGSPAHVVHFANRSPEGTITLHRDSPNGQGFGPDETLTLEFDRVAAAYGRVVVGVIIQQGGGHKAFADVPSANIRVRQGYTELANDGFEQVPAETAAIVAEFTRDPSGDWQFHRGVRRFADQAAFDALMGSK